MPTTNVTGRHYPAWLVEQRGWTATPDGASLYIQPKEIWVDYRDQAGRHIGPKHLIHGKNQENQASS